MKIIPAIDIIDGKCVRLSKGDYSTKKVYNEDPLEVAKSFEDNNIRFLHLVDLDGAKSKRIVNYQVLEKLATNTNLHIDFGGGIKSNKDIEIAFNCGANQISAGSVAMKNQMLMMEWLERYGNEKIILGADCNNRMIATDGWLENSDMNVIDFIQFYQKKGVKHVVSTDIAKDGMLAGPAFDLYAEILKRTNIQLVASGGISDFSDLKSLEQMGCSGAIIGKAIYEGRIPLKELSELC